MTDEQPEAVGTVEITPYGKPSPGSPTKNADLEAPEPSEATQELDLAALAPLIKVVGTQIRSLEKQRGDVQIEHTKAMSHVLLRFVYVAGALLAAVIGLAAFALSKGNDALAQGIVMGMFALFGGAGLNQVVRKST